MSITDHDLLRLVREWRPPATLHPIAMQAWHIYENDGLTLSDSSLQKLRTLLDSYDTDLRTLGEALEGLVRFSILLTDHQRDPESAAKVVALMREYAPRFEPFFARVVEAMTGANGTTGMPATELPE